MTLFKVMAYILMSCKSIFIDSKHKYAIHCDICCVFNCNCQIFLLFCYNFPKIRLLFCYFFFKIIGLQK